MVIFKPSKIPIFLGCVTMLRCFPVGSWRFRKSPVQLEEPTAMQCRRCGRLDFDMEPGDMDACRQTVGFQKNADGDVHGDFTQKKLVI